jgi:hypothetical protein
MSIIFDDTKKKFIATVPGEDGHGTQVYEGDTEREVIEKLISAQANSTKKINDLSRQRKPATPTPAAPAPQPRDLTPDEKFRLTTDLQDPTKAAEAIQKVIETKTGTSLSKISETVNDEEIERRIEEGQAETRRWLENSPVAGRYFRDVNDPTSTPEQRQQAAINSEILLNRMQLQRLAITEENLDTTFMALLEGGFFRELPASAPATEPGAPPVDSSAQPGRGDSPRQAVRPRGSTGLRNSHSSGYTTPTRETFTRADIERMPRAEYNQRIKDPSFQAMVNRLYSGAHAK